MQESDVTGEHKKYINNSTVRTFAVLELLTKSSFPLSINDITNATNLDKTTVRRFLVTLWAIGYIEKTSDNKYKVTSRVLDLSSSYLRHINLPEQAIPYLEEFCELTNTSANLGILDNQEVVYVAHVSEKQALSTGVTIGTRLPAHATAVGKVLLSFLSDKEILDLYEDKLPVFTVNTISTTSILNGALWEIKKQGWAVSEEEYEKGVRAAATPITDGEGNLISAINVSTRIEHIPKLKFYKDIVPSLIETASKISNQMRLNSSELL